jgi:hypothetical protein
MMLGSPLKPAVLAKVILFSVSIFMLKNPFCFAFVVNAFVLWLDFF